MIQKLVTPLLLLHPVVMLFIHDVGNAILFLLLLLSLVTLVFRIQPEAESARFLPLLKRYWPLHVAMLFGFVAVLLHQLSSGHFQFKSYDRSLRLAVFPLIFWLMFFVPLRHLKLLQWSFLLTAFIAVVKAYFFTQGGQLREGNIGFISIIAYSNLALLSGILCLISFGWNDPRQRGILVLKVLACTAGAGAAVLTATRGSWLVVPFLAILFVFEGRMAARKKWAWLISAVLVGVLLFSLNKGARDRISETSSDLQTYSDTGRRTSTGIRLQLWGAALTLIERAPVFGIGRENYEPSIKAMVERHDVTGELGSLAHSHNEILFNTVISGIFGLIATLALYLVPGFYFVREFRHRSPAVRTAARMGCVLVLGFFAFGLTDLMFFWTVLSGYYILVMSALLVCMIKGARAEPATATATQAVSPLSHRAPKKAY